MEITHALYPEQEHLVNLLKKDYDGKVAMLNLLKFRSVAAYEDDEGSQLSGREAYQLYGGPMLELVQANGGQLLYSGAPLATVIGSLSDAWDSVAIVEYPSFSDFVRIISLPEVARIQRHRAAGLAGQLLIAMQDSPNSTEI
ncbi:MAG: DUF1330 domain-containing protein [Gammaproteobacteria bacterium]